MMMSELPDPHGLHGRVAIVTGASSGIGRHVAELFVANGVRVIGLARRADRLEEMEKAYGTDCFRGIPVDLGVTEELQKRFVEAKSCFGPCDILVNAAGVGVIKPALDHRVQDWEHALSINLTAPFELSRLVVEAWKGRELSIINISSPAATRPGPGLSAYAASKAALVQLTRVLAIEWATFGVRVNSLSPGHMPTELNGGLRDPKTIAWIERTVPMGRAGLLSDLDSSLLLLAGSGSRYITGIDLAVDGGATLN